MIDRILQVTGRVVTEPVVCAYTPLIRLTRPLRGILIRNPTPQHDLLEPVPVGSEIATEHHSISMKPSDFSLLYKATYGATSSTSASLPLICGGKSTPKMLTNATFGSWKSLLKNASIPSPRDDIPRAHSHIEIYSNPTHTKQRKWHPLKASSSQ